MTESRVTRLLLRLGTAATLVFIYVPLAIVGLYAFNENVTQKWPIENYSTKWFSVAFQDEAVREALVLSVLAGLQATIVDILGPLGFSFGLSTIIIGHATFCVVVVYNNVIARMRRTAGSLDEASADLGADSWQTFRYVMLPQMRTALLAGGLLAFALSFDEVVVTIFTSGAQQTLPIWIFATLSRPAELPIVNVVALFVIIVSVIPVWFAQKLAGGNERDTAKTMAVTEP